MDTNESRNTLDELKRHEDMMNYQADTFARLVVPRLERCSEWTLIALKKRLRNWDSNKKQWSDKLTR